MDSRTLVKNLVTIGLVNKTVIHGFRSSFRTWTSERTDVPREVCEMVLAQTVGNAKGKSYARRALCKTCQVNAAKG